MDQAIAEGAFVLTNFPFGPPNRPDQPGPVPHIAYCLGVQTSGRGPELILAYTSSGPWRPPGRTVPVGVIEFDRAAASLVNQKPFHLDLRVLARIPLSPSWLPRLNTPDHGIVARADRALRDRINAAAERLVRRRPEVIQVRGIGSRPPA
ncbi:MAG TPA: hypothetical protein VGM42_05590 [Rhodopila sp.]